MDIIWIFKSLESFQLEHQLLQGSIKIWSEKRFLVNLDNEASSYCEINKTLTNKLMNYKTDMNS